MDPDSQKKSARFLENLENMAKKPQFDSFKTKYTKRKSIRCQNHEYFRKLNEINSKHNPFETKVANPKNYSIAELLVKNERTCTMRKKIMRRKHFLVKKKKKKRHSRKMSKKNTYIDS